MEQPISTSIRQRTTSPRRGGTTACGDQSQPERSPEIGNWTQKEKGRWECWERAYGDGVTAMTMRTRDAVTHRVVVSLQISSRQQNFIMLSTSLCGETYPTAKAAKTAADDVACGLLAIFHRRQQADRTHPDLCDRKAAYKLAWDLVHHLSPIDLDAKQGQVKSVADAMVLMGWSRSDAAEAHREHIQAIRSTLGAV